MRQKVGEQTSPSPFSLLKSQWAPYRIEIRTLPFPQLMHDGNTMRRAALLLFQLSELIPKGRRRGEIQTEVVGYLEHRNAQLYSVLPLFSLCLGQCLSICPAQHSTDQVLLQTKKSAVAPGSVLQQHSRAPQEDTCSQDGQWKDLCFPFTSALFLWDVAHCQAGVALISERDILRCVT